MVESLQQKTFSGVAWGFVNNFATQIFFFIQGIILARILAPSDYGLVAMVAVFTAVSNVLVDSGFGSALIRKKNRTELDYSTVFDVNVCISLLLLIVLCSTSGLIAKFYRQPILAQIVCVNAVIIFLNSFMSIQGVKLTADLKFKQKNIINIVSAFASGITAIIMAFTGFGIWSLIYPNFITIVVNIILYWHFQHWFPGIRFSKESFRELFGFGSKLLASSLLDKIYTNIYPIIIGKCYSSDDLGYYTRASNYSQLPSTTVTGVLSGVAYPVLSDIQDDEERLSNAYRKLLRISAFIVFPVMIGLAALARPLIIVMITDKWEQSVIYLQILCLAMMWYPIHSLNLNLLNVKGRSDLFLKLEIIKKVLGVSILLITVPLGILALCIGSVFSSLISLSINTHYTGKIIHMGFWKQMMDLVPVLAYSLSMGALVWVVTLFIPSYAMKLIVGIPLGAIYYFGIAYITKSSELDYLKIIIENNILSRFKK